MIGVIAGVLVVWSVFFWDKMGIDDPVGAICVHGVNGLWGVICARPLRRRQLRRRLERRRPRQLPGVAGKRHRFVLRRSKQFLAELIDVGVNSRGTSASAA